MGMVVVDPKTGYIKCMVGGYDYNADENHVNHATAKRPVGSTFKAFTLATAIQNGMNPNVTLNCNSPLKAKGTTTEVQNYANQSYGNITLKQATAYSSNTGYIQWPRPSATARSSRSSKNSASILLRTISRTFQS